MLRLVLLLTVAGLVLASLSLISQFMPFVPDYDGLTYYALAELVQQWLMGEADGRLWISASRYVDYWPITNGPSVYFAALFGDLLHGNRAPIFLHAMYLLAFLAYVVRARGVWFATAAIALLCGQGMFYRLFTTLTSDFGVGLWLVALLVAMASEGPERRRILWFLVPIGLALRTVDAVFIVCVATASLVAEWLVYRRPIALKTMAWHIGLPLAVSAAVLWRQFVAAFYYVRETTMGDSAESWKSVGGVSTHLDVLNRYIEFVQYYHPWTLWVLVLALVACPLMRGDQRRAALRAVLLGGAVVVPLVTAGALHIQVAFWVYAAVVFVVLETAREVLQTLEPASRRALPRALMIAAIAVSFWTMLSTAWTREVHYLRQLSEYQRLTKPIVHLVAQAEDIQYMATNYFGIGPLASAGIALASGRKLHEANVRNVYAKGLALDHYMQFSDTVNLYVAARRNYFFPKHFGINDHVAEIAERLQREADQRGFLHVGQAADRGRVFDMWYRPGAVLFPEFAAYGDQWIGQRLPVRIGTPSLCGTHTVSGTLTLNLMLPAVTEAPAFLPPFAARLVDAHGATWARMVARHPGAQVVDLPLAGLACGDYELVFDQQFSTAADPRRLSALLQGHAAEFKVDRPR